MQHCFFSHLIREAKEKETHCNSPESELKLSMTTLKKSRCRAERYIRLKIRNKIIHNLC